MPKDIIINSTVNEVRVAILDSGSVSEIYVERARNKGIVGNIYKGKVLKVLPGMQSAFVDVGLAKACFLHVSDVYIDDAEFFSLVDDKVADVLDETHIKSENNNKNIYVPIEDLIKEGQEIVVQVVKEPIGQKGPRVTTHITIPGRYLVLMPSYDHIGVSRKIENDEERERLKSILTEIKPKGIGLIARTVCEGSNKDELKADLDYLLRLWKKTNDKAQKMSAPSVLYEDLDLIYRTLRDYTNDDVKKIIVDSKSEYLKIKEFVREFLPNSNLKIEVYEGELPIFDYFNIEIEINRLTDRRVWLKSGGYIVIDQAEALTVIDVNTGKYVGKRNFDETILKTNIEAAKEIAWQLRLRNIGGIIIVDFIDMERQEHREKVLKTLEDELAHDRAKSTVVNISPLGLFEITRKRVQESLTRILTEPCPYCEGRGVIKSKITISYDIMRELRRIAPFFTKKSVQVEAHPDIVDMILSYEKESLDDIELVYNISIEMKPNSSFHLEHYEILPF